MRKLNKWVLSVGCWVMSALFCHNAMAQLSGVDYFPASGSKNLGTHKGLQVGDGSGTDSLIGSNGVVVFFPYNDGGFQIDADGILISPRTGNSTFFMDSAGQIIFENTGLSITGTGVAQIENDGNITITGHDSILINADAVIKTYTPSIINQMIGYDNANIISTYGYSATQDSAFSLKINSDGNNSINQVGRLKYQFGTWNANSGSGFPFVELSLNDTLTGEDRYNVRIDSVYGITLQDTQTIILQVDTGVVRIPYLGGGGVGLVQHDNDGVLSGGAGLSAWIIDGDDNMYAGTGALSSLSGGTLNMIAGINAGASITDGILNSFYGQDNDVGDGSNTSNTLLGYGNSVTGNNNTLVGVSNSVTGSNCIVMGGYSVQADNVISLGATVGSAADSNTFIVGFTDKWLPYGDSTTTLGNATHRFSTAYFDLPTEADTAGTHFILYRIAATNQVFWKPD